MISDELLQTILKQYRLPLNGVHGISHWARVLENGRMLAASTGALLPVVELFAVLHDSRRPNEGVDFTHARLGADYAASLRGRLFELSDADFQLLYTACRDHTSGKIEADVTVQTCWDSDRLDLGRVGITPDPRRLCTPTARLPETIAWGEKRARVRAVPSLVLDEWRLRLDGHPSA
ncbi:MAG: hypothetical protein P4L50_15820 [Anaerolineaceae bacterium]|nr:hypothetical protein [Anaerolineaceae bacterium]